MKSVKNQGFTLVELLVVIGSIGILSAAILPATSNAVLQANMTEVGMKGRDIFVAIEGANTQRKLLGLESLWPKTQISSSGGIKSDLSDMAFCDSSVYFYELYDGQNFGTDAWQPYVVGFDYSKLSGAGISTHIGWSVLQAENNMWTIAANIRDEMENIIPVLVTRNVVASDLAYQYRGIINFEVALGENFSTPFSNTGFVMIRKSGAIFKASAKYSNAHAIYQGKPFGLNTPSDIDPMVYLSPMGSEMPQGF